MGLVPEYGDNRTVKFMLEVNSGTRWNRSDLRFDTFGEAADYGAIFKSPLRIVRVTTIEEFSEVINAPK